MIDILTLTCTEGIVFHKDNKSIPFLKIAIFQPDTPRLRMDGFFRQTHQCVPKFKTYTMQKELGQ